MSASIAQRGPASFRLRHRPGIPGLRGPGGVITTVNGKTGTDVSLFGGDISIGAPFIATNGNPLTVYQTLNEMVEGPIYQMDPSGAQAQSAFNRTCLASAIALRPYGSRIGLRRGAFALDYFPPLPAGTGFTAQGAYATTMLMTNATGVLIDMPAASFLEGMKIASVATRTADPTIRMLANECHVEHVTLEGCFGAIQVGSDAVDAIGAKINCVTIRSPAIGPGSFGILGANFSGMSVTEVLLAGPSSGQQPDYGIRLRRGDTVTLFKVNSTLHGNGLLMDPGVGQNIYAPSLSQCLWDSAGTISGGAAAWGAQIIPNGGGIYDLDMAGQWFGLSKAGGLLMTTYNGGVLQASVAAACKYIGNTGPGLRVAGSGVKNLNMVGQIACANGDNGAYFSDVSDFVLGIIAGVDASHGGGNTGHGVVIGGTSNWFEARGVARGNGLTPGAADYSTGTQKSFAFVTD